MTVGLEPETVGGAAAYGADTGLARLIAGPAASEEPQWTTAWPARRLAHSIAHLLLAVGVLLTAGSLRGCRTLLSICGVAMIAIAVYGQLDSSPPLPQLVPTGTADAWLHIALGSTMLAATAAGHIHRRTASNSV
ncbi:DUF4383 domain-containing protein [Kribbella sp. NPDC048928]|uniref:DUF4383 domain-containing protein n=1 Tax=Kribbella sp. NPDC048928 TaxID=3364111 RepID=UPI003723E710